MPHNKFPKLLPKDKEELDRFSAYLRALGDWRAQNPFATAHERITAKHLLYAKHYPEDHATKPSNPNG